MSDTSRANHISNWRPASALLLAALTTLACSPLSFLATPTPTNTPLPRSAQVSEIRNLVEMRPRAADAWRPAQEGGQLAAGGGVRTGDDSRARVDISDGSLLRLAPATEFELTALSAQSVDPVTEWSLLAGRVWIQVTQALGLGSFEVETPSGTASVRGSLMSVAFFPANGHAILSCLEGLCRLTGQSGAFTDLTAGEQSEIPGFGQDPSPPKPIDAAQAADWQAEFPEAEDLVATLTPGPPPTATPSPTATFTPTPSPTATPTPSPTATSTPIAAVGRWQGTTSQGWAISFEVTADRNIASFRIEFPVGAVPCTNGRVVSVQLSEGVEVPISGDRFSVPAWELEGEFIGPQQVRGTVNYTNPGPDCTVLEPVGTWEARGP